MVVEAHSKSDCVRVRAVGLSQNLVLLPAPKIFCCGVPSLPMPLFVGIHTIYICRDATKATTYLVECVMHFLMNSQERTANHVSWQNAGMDSVELTRSYLMTDRPVSAH